MATGVINNINNETENLTIDPGASGDSYIQLDINGAGIFRFGVDDDDGDKLKIARWSNLATNNFFVMTSSGERTLPRHPAFSAKAVDQNGVTGDGTFYTITFTHAEYFDQGYDFNGTSTFTAPHYGLYRFDIMTKIGGITSDNDYVQLRLTTPSYDFRTNICNPYTTMDSSNEWSGTASLFVEVGASQAVTSQVYVTGSASKNINVIGDGTFFSGYLVC
jgi:hypothetical protein